MSLATGISALATRVATEFNSVRAAIGGKADTVHTHAGADITGGTVPFARLPTGTAGTTVAIGNHNHDAAYQPLDADLSAIAGLGVTNDSIIQGKSGSWAKRTIAQFKTDLNYTASDIGLGSVNNTADSAKPVSTAQAAADLLRAGGVVGRNRRTTAEVGAAGSGAIFPVLSAIAPVVNGRSYRVWVQAEVRNSAAGGATSQCELRFTTNNTEPTTTSTVMARALTRHDGIDIPDMVRMEVIYTATATGTLRVLFTASRPIGTGTLTVDAGTTGPCPTELVIEDIGPTVAESGTDY